jgi:SAM-dependent methyltransferase
MTIKFGKEYFKFALTHQVCDYRAKGTWQRDYVRFIKRLFDLTGKKCLDFGSAMGVFTSAFRDANVDMQGVDISDWYIENCPFENAKKNLFTFQDDKMPFEDETFDFIHSQQVLEHIPLDLAEVEIPELARICKPGAIFYINTVGHSDEPVEERDDPTHVSCYAREVWYELFDKWGWENITPQYEKKWENEPFVLEYKWSQMVFRKK